MGKRGEQHVGRKGEGFRAAGVGRGVGGGGRDGGTRVSLTT